ncbi:MAG: T9SS type A sorting domain-containing protein [Ferruginibacter sp.]
MDYHGGTVNTIRITSFPANANTMSINGIMYKTASGTCPVVGACTTWPSGGVVIPFTDGSGPTQLILIDPVDGPVKVRINYASTDNAGLEDPTPGYVEVEYNLTVVPVRIEKFTAAPQGSNVNLTWVIDGEINIDRYEPEFSTNSRDFTKIGSKPATGSRTYNLLHTSPINGINYYRLKIIELDGSVSYTDIRKVVFNKAGGITVYPNPTKDVVNINFTGMGSGKSATVRIIGTDGRVLLEKKFYGAVVNESIDIRHLASGSYIVRVETDGGIFNKLLELVK